MPRPNRKPDPEAKARVLAEARRIREQREQGYREQALKLFPHVCGRCGRDFSGKNLRELTVHHRDGNHHNNPPDGSNWELLCAYCHVDEHQRADSTGYHAGSRPVLQDAEPLGDSPFAALRDFLKPDNKDGD